MVETFAIKMLDLHKDFGEVYAVQGVNLEIQKGEIFSLLGPNGAGKSTTISMLSGLLEPTKGDALIMGHSITKEPIKAKEAIGVVPQEIALYDDLTARENLMFWGRMYSLSGSELKTRVDEVLEVIQLTDRQKSKVSTFSGGMKRRTNIGVALLHKPKILFMDEPTVGIDPQSRRNILDNVKELNQEGMTILYTTHYMEEAQELSDHIGIIDHGKVIANGTHEELVKQVGEYDRIDLQLTDYPDTLLEEWRGLPGVESVAPNGESNTVRLLVDDSNDALPQLFESSSRTNVRITGVEILEPNLETVFLHLTGRALRD